MNDQETISIVVAHVNRPPELGSIGDKTVNEGETALFSVTASDPDGDVLAIGTYTQPANGTLTLNADGSLTYTPDPDFNGTDGFTYSVFDGNGGSAGASVTITVISSPIPTTSCTRSTRTLSN